jgi:hypothetical protein
VSFDLPQLSQVRLAIGFLSYLFVSAIAHKRRRDTRLAQISMKSPRILERHRRADLVARIRFPSMHPADAAFFQQGSCRENRRTLAASKNEGATHAP